MGVACATPWFISTRAYTDPFQLLSAILLLTALAIILAYSSALAVKKPLERLTRSLGDIKPGGKPSEIPRSDVKELDQLAAAAALLVSQFTQKLRAINKRSAELEAVLECMHEGVVAVDFNMRILAMNSSAAKLLDLRVGKTKGYRLQDIASNGAFLRYVEDLVHTRNPMEADIPALNQSTPVLRIYGRILESQTRGPLGVLLVLSDTTHIHRLENIRRDFVANVSHELKTPITSIKGFVETLLEGSYQDPEELKHFLKIISRQADRLHAIIEDLLTLARLEQEPGKVRIELAESRIRDIIHAAVELSEVKARQKNIALQVECDPVLSAKVNPALLEQALVNLIDNAVKYSGENTMVTIKAQQSVGSIIISIIDQGCGIEPEHLPRLFERFYRVDKARSRELGGTGLGLALVKHICQAHGGRATVESEPGKGSSFSIHLPT